MTDVDFCATQQVLGQLVFPAALLLMSRLRREWQSSPEVFEVTRALIWGLDYNFINYNFNKPLISLKRILPEG